MKTHRSQLCAHTYREPLNPPEAAHHCCANCFVKHPPSHVTQAVTYWELGSVAYSIAVPSSSRALIPMLLFIHPVDNQPFSVHFSVSVLFACLVAASCRIATQGCAAGRHLPLPTTIVTDQADTDVQDPRASRQQLPGRTYIACMLATYPSDCTTANLCVHTNSVETCRDLVVTNGQMSGEGMREEVCSGTRTLDTFRSDVGKYLAQQQQIKALAASVDCGVVRIRLQVRHQGMQALCCLSHVLPYLA